MKKKTLALLLSAAVVAAMTAGCGSGEKETEAPKTEAVTESVTEAAQTETEEVIEAVTTEAETHTEETTEVAETETEEATEAVETETETETEKATEAVETETETETEKATEAVETETETETEEATEAAETETETETEEATEAAETETETETEEATEAAETETETETEEATEAVETETETEEATEAAETETETETEEATEAVETETETETEEATEAVETETETEEATEAVETETEAAETEEVTEVTADVYEGEFTIGISQFAEHGSLDNCREGFLEGLAEAGFVEGENLTVEFDNAQTDTGTAGQIADSYVSDKVDLICAIATPSAMSAYNSALKTDIPVVYTAVSDPVAAGLANEDGTSVGNATGTSDKLPVEEQLKMIREILPDAAKIGIIYTTSEANSVSTIEEYKAIAGEYGFEIVETGINTIADVDLAAADMVGKVDCISNLTDNTVVSALQTVLAYANEAHIPVFGSEIEQVKNGCLASMGIDYISLGRQTGNMAAAILKGEATAADLNYQICEGANLYVNKEVADNLEITFDEDYLAGAAEVFEKIVVD